MNNEITRYDLEYKGVRCTGVKWRYPEPHIFYFMKDGKNYEFAQTEYIKCSADTAHILRVIEEQFLPWLKDKHTTMNDRLTSLLIEFDEMGYAPTTVCPDAESEDGMPLVTDYVRRIANAMLGALVKSYYAEKLGITHAYLCSTVKQVMGRTCGDIISDMVIMDAKSQLKSTHLSIQDISDSLHFANMSFFGKYFKRYVGMSPLEYRNKG